MQTPSVPGEVLSRLSEQHGFQVRGPALPHDFWSAVDLPNITLDQSIALLLAGFGKWFERSSDGTEINVIDFPSPQEGKLSLGNFPDARERVTQLRKEFSDLRISISGKTITATGRPLDLADAKAALIRSNDRAAGSTVVEKRYTLTTRNSRGTILASVAQQTGNQLEFQPELHALLSEVIDLNVNQVTLEQLIENVLAGTSAKHLIEDGRLKIVPK